MRKVAVILSGAGYLDGSEINEAVLTLLALDKHHAQAIVYAPDIEQYQVIDHITHQKSKESRNVLVESARIVRGKIQNLALLDIHRFDALILPGGYGAALNLSDIASVGTNSSVLPSLHNIILECLRLKKPIGAICISPALLAIITHNTATKLKLTLGNQHTLLTELDIAQQPCKTSEIVTDYDNKVVCTPAFMLEDTLYNISIGIEKLVIKVLELTKA